MLKINHRYLYMWTDKTKRIPSRERVAKKTLEIREKGISFCLKFHSCGGYLYKYLPQIQYFNIHDIFTF